MILTTLLTLNGQEIIQKLKLLVNRLREFLHACNRQQRKLLYSLKWNYTCLIRFISKIEPKIVNSTIDHSDWVQTMQHELNEFERNRVCRLIPTPKDAYVVGLKWVFQSKMDK